MATTIAAGGRIDLIESHDEKKVRTGGFRSFGHFGATLALAGDMSGRGREGNPQARAALEEYKSLYNRVAAAEGYIRAVSGLNESVDPEGGAVVPSALAGEVWMRSLSYGNLFDRVAPYTITTGNALTVPALAESSRATGSRNGGTVAYWTPEGTRPTPTKPNLRTIELILKKLSILIYTSSELVDDANGSSGPALAQYLDRVSAAEIAFNVNDALINGTGAGLIQGVLSAGALITVDAVSGQGASTIVAQNITDMWARVYGPSRRTGVWLMNQGVDAQLDGLKFATGSSSGQLVYMPPVPGADESCFTIKGRPALVVEQCPALGTKGDIVFVDFEEIAGLMKATGINQTASIHLRFDYDEKIFKYVLRIDAQPYRSSPLTPFKGSATQSPFVALSSTRT